MILSYVTHLQNKEPRKLPIEMRHRERSVATQRSHCEASWPWQSNEVIARHRRCRGDLIGIAGGLLRRQTPRNDVKNNRLPRNDNNMNIFSSYRQSWGELSGLTSRKADCKIKTNQNLGSFFLGHYWEGQREHDLVTSPETMSFVFSRGKGSQG
jgi:hypothetical protein